MPVIGKDGWEWWKVGVGDYQKFIADLQSQLRFSSMTHSLGSIN